MPTPLHIPPGGYGRHAAQFGDGPSAAAAPFLGVTMFLLLLLVLATAYLLMRPGGYLANRQLTRQPAPEDDAKRVLADRYAKGDMTTDDFLERASVLNWTPGSEVYQSPKKRW